MYDGQHAFILLAALETRHEEFTEYVVEAATRKAEADLGEHYNPANLALYERRIAEKMKLMPDHPIFRRK
jgi:hypothetical protein